MALLNFVNDNLEEVSIFTTAIAGMRVHHASNTIKCIMQSGATVVFDMRNDSEKYAIYEAFVSNSSIDIRPSECKVPYNG